MEKALELRKAASLRMVNVDELSYRKQQSVVGGLTRRAVQENAPGGCQAQPLKGISMLQGPFHSLSQPCLYIIQPSYAVP